MLQRLQALADGKGLEFGVKITNTFPVDVKQNELPSEEMYMSGKSLYPLSMSVAGKLAEDFGGKLRISYSGGADFFNIADIVDAGIWPVTMATTMLKPGGYERLEQIGQLFAAKEAAAFEAWMLPGNRTGGGCEIRQAPCKGGKAPSFQENQPAGSAYRLFHRPLSGSCPIHQDIHQIPAAGRSR